MRGSSAEKTPSRLERILAGASNLAMTGCAAGLLYSGFTAATPPEPLAARQLLSASTPGPARRSFPIPLRLPLATNEYFLGITPRADVYVTAEEHQVDGGPQNLSRLTTILRFNSIDSTLTNHPLATHIVSGTVSSCSQPFQCDNNGAIAVLTASFDRHLANPHIHLFTPPSYNLERVIEDAKQHLFTGPGKLAYTRLGRYYTTIEETDIKGSSTRIIAAHLSPRGYIFGDMFLRSLLCLPLIGMGVWGYRYSFSRRMIGRKSSRTDSTGADEGRRETILDTIADHPWATICASSAATLAGLATHTGLSHTELLTPWETTISAANLVTQSTLFGLITYLPVVSIRKLKIPRHQSLIKLLRHAFTEGTPADWHDDKKAYCSTFIQTSSAENQFNIALDLLSQHRYANARLHLYKALEEQQDPAASPFNFLTYTASLIERATDYCIFLGRAPRSENPARRLLSLEIRQAGIAIHGASDRALSYTHAILQRAGDDIEAATMHQARIHSLCGSPRADELWRSCITSILSRTPANTFTPVAGGTSEVLKVPEQLNPYAEKTLILKRSKNHEDLRREADVTRAVSKAVGGIDGMSSLPLGFVQAHEPTDPSYFIILQHDGQTLDHHVRRRSRQETEAMLRDHILPSIARYHNLLERHHDELEEILPSPDYVQTFEEKCVRRVTCNPHTQQCLREAGYPVATYFSKAPRAPIHNDLHAGNLLITPAGCIIIDPADAAIGHPSLDLAHLLYDPAFRLDPIGIISLLNHYRALRGQDPSASRTADIAGSWLRLCHLVGRDIAYQRPDELAHHARSLETATITLGEMDIPGINRTTLEPIIKMASRLACG